MLRAIAYRGRDRTALKSVPPVTLGHLLTRVTHEDTFDAQPLGDPPNQLLATADLRLDNREELGEALAIRPQVLAGMADSALILPAYRKWGDDFVRHLLGDFTIALWDGAQSKLLLARDHMGQRPLFFHRGVTVLAFASEPKALWALQEVPYALDEMEVAKHLLADLTPGSGRTFFSGIESLSGGMVLTARGDGAVDTHHYWQPCPAPIHQGRDEAYYVETYRRVLTEAVACRIRRTTKPAGLFFAGGFDSTAIAGVAGPVVSAQGRKLVCASSVMPEDYAGPLRHARPWVELARQKLRHLDVHYVTREGRDFLDSAPGAYVREDLPHGVDRYVNDALFAALSNTGVRVVMDGHGGDYTLNPRASEMIAEFLRRGRLVRFASEFRAYVNQPGITLVSALRKITADLAPGFMDWQRKLRGFHSDYLNELLAPELAVRARAAGLISAYERLRKRRPDHRTRMLRLLQAMAAGTGMGPPTLAAQYGMEFTRPFHDKRVVEFALAVPDDLHFKHGRERHLAKLALGDIYPREFQTRGTENDDTTPDFVGMVERIQPKLLAEIGRLERSSSLRRIFNFDGIRQNVAGPLSTDKEPVKARGVVASARMLLWAGYIEWFRRDNN
jgi:asparagine synthase (glutamine-hydrolysing)